MSVQAMSWVLDHSEAEGIDRLCLLSLANHTNKAEDDLAWPSLKTIAREMRVSESTAHRSIRALTTAGLVEVIRNGAPDERIPANRRPNAYRILGYQVDTPGSSGVSNQRPRGVKSGDSGVSLLTPNPSTYPLKTAPPSPSRGEAAEKPGLGDAEAMRANAGRWGEMKSLLGKREEVDQ